MKKVIKTLKLLLKTIGVLFLLIIFFIALSIPYGKKSEMDIKEFGVKYQKIALLGVHIIPMEIDSILYNRNIYIENNKIVEITSDTFINSGYEVIRAEGKFVMPGLIDMYTHIFDRTDLPQYLSYGVITVRNMMGFPMHLRWKEQLKQNKLPGSNLITATPTINSGDNAGPFYKTVLNAEEARIAVEDYIDEGYDFVKVYDDIDSLQMKSIEHVAKLKNVQIAGHPPKMSLEGLLSSSITSIEHTEELLKFLDEERSEESMHALAKKIKASNKAVTLNLVAFNRINRISKEGPTYYNSLQKDYLNTVTKFIGTKQLEVYAQAGPKYKVYAETKYRAMENLSRILSEAGVTILFGTDSGPNFIAAGVSVGEELKLLKAARLSEYSILRSATYSAAKVLNNNELGKIAIHATADLLVLNEKPLLNLETLSNPNMLFSNHTYYSENDLLEVRKIGEDKQNVYATLGLFLAHLFIK